MTLHGQCGRKHGFSASCVLKLLSSLLIFYTNTLLQLKAPKARHAHIALNLALNRPFPASSGIFLRRLEARSNKSGSDTVLALQRTSPWERSS